jgi:hypothetical protein
VSWSLENTIQIIDNSGVMLPIVASLMIVIYDCEMGIVQGADANFKLELVHGKIN